MATHFSDPTPVTAGRAAEIEAEAREVVSMCQRYFGTQKALFSASASGSGLPGITTGDQVHNASTALMKARNIDYGAARKSVLLLFGELKEAYILDPAGPAV